MFQPRTAIPTSPSVEVRLLPDKVVEEKMPPPPLPLVAPRPAIVALPPLMIQNAAAPPSQAPLAISPPRPPAVAGNGAPGPPQPSPPSSDYLRRLVAYLNGYKNYPHEARQRREEGVVRLHFVMDRSGRVLSYDIAGSSGSVALDEAARDLIRRAQPLPPVPADYPGERLDLIVPVVFSLH